MHDPLKKERRDHCSSYFNAGSERWNKAPICRQASGDGSLGEYGGLWSQEDNMVIVI
jgi:hypothetical protein